MDLQAQRGVGLGLRVPGDVVLLEVALDVLAARDARGVLRAHGAGGHLLRRRRRDRLEHLDLLVADLVGLEGGRRLHAHEREQLQHVVLDEVAQRARLVVVARSRADPDVLGGGDLDVVDEVAVPDRLEHVVGEPERHHVLDGLLAQVVIDAVDLLLAEGGGDGLLQLARGIEVGAERLLDDHPHVGLTAVVEVRLLERGRDHAEVLRRGREIERAVERVALALERVERLRELAVAVLVVEREPDVGEPLEQPVEHGVVGLPARELLDRLAREVAELVVGLLAARDPDQVEALGQRPFVGEVVDRRQQLAPGEIPGGAEDDERRPGDGQALQSLDERVLLVALGDGRFSHFSRRPRSARPRGRRTGCAARPGRGWCSRRCRASRSVRRGRP